MKRLLPILLLVFSVTVGAETVDYAGGTYTGELVNGVPHAQGTWTHPEGDKYVGEFKNGMRHGQGTYIYSDGRKYVGEYKDGKRHGQGTQYEKKGNVFTRVLTHGKALEGDTKKGYYAHIGERTCWLPRNLKKKLTGPLDCLRDVEGGYWNPSEGEGFYVFNDGGWRKISEMHGQQRGKYVGEWRDGKEHGHGTRIFGKGKFEGDEYVGEFKRGKKHGQGTYTWRNGVKYVGEYKDGKEWEGTAYDTDGNVIAIYSEGKRQSQATPTQAVAKDSDEPEESSTSWSPDFKKGLAAAKSGDFATALGEWRPLAEQGGMPVRNTIWV